MSKVGLLAAFTLGAVSVTAGQHLVADNEIRACRDTATGLLRIPNDTACLPNEEAITWNRTGPRGPQGVPGPAGDAGTTEPGEPLYPAMSYPHELRQLITTPDGGVHAATLVEERRTYMASFTDAAWTQPAEEHVLSEQTGRIFAAGNEIAAVTPTTSDPACGDAIQLNTWNAGDGWKTADTIPDIPGDPCTFPDRIAVLADLSLFTWTHLVVDDVIHLTFMRWTPDTGWTDVGFPDTESKSPPSFTLDMLPGHDGLSIAITTGGGTTRAATWTPDEGWGPTITTQPLHSTPFASPSGLALAVATNDAIVFLSADGTVQQPLPLAGENLHGGNLMWLDDETVVAWFSDCDVQACTTRRVVATRESMSPAADVEATPAQAAPLGGDSLMLGYRSGTYEIVPAP